VQKKNHLQKLYKKSQNHIM